MENMTSSPLNPLIYIADGERLGGAAIQGDSAAFKRTSALTPQEPAQPNPPLPMSLLVIEHPNGNSACSELGIKQMK